MSLAADDFSVGPWGYPGTAPAYSGLLRDGRYFPGETFPSAGRELVVAVGSNASPGVMHRKFALAGVDATVPFLLGAITGLTIGHSAHVSRHGYIAAAPVLDPSARTAVVASLLDIDQLEALDRTEPNYTRRLVRSQICRLVLDGDEQPATFLVYASKWGVLAPSGVPLPLMSQEELCAVLRPFSPYDGLPFRAAMRKLAADEQLRDETREAFARAGWVASSGLEPQVDPGGT